MQLSFIERNNHPRLLLVYAGWSTDESAFKSLSCPGYDIAVVSDYSVLGPPEVSPAYREVVLIAWSLGVKAAEITARNLPLTLTIAVNGTANPVSDDEGIPSAIFDATTCNLSEISLTKFRRRMGATHLPRGPRSVNSLKSELRAVKSWPDNDFRWDRAVISSADLIFPPDNQRKFWHGKAEVTEIDGPHMPDFNSIVRRFVIDKQLVGSRFARGRKTYSDSADVQQRIAGHLFDLWLKHRGNTQQILEIGAGNGLFTNIYAPKFNDSELTLWDIVPGETPFAPVFAADAEAAIRDIAAQSFNAVVSASTMQWFNSPAAFLSQCLRVLKPGGLAVLSTFGPQTFAELTQAGVTPLPYLGEDALRRIIPAGFRIEEMHSGLITKVFDTPVDALRHLQQTGVNARPTSRPIHSILSAYPKRADGRVSLTYQPTYLILRKI